MRRLGTGVIELDALKAFYEEATLRKGASEEASPQVVIVRFSGWVNSAALAHVMERRFFHVRAAGTTWDRWVQHAEARFDFECFWLPLVPISDIQSPQQQWIQQHYEALMESSGNGHR